MPKRLPSNNEQNNMLEPQIDDDENSYSICDKDFDEEEIHIL
jgi:hypothetical protein